MLKEFREFIQRGNVMDLAVGVIIGAAFGKIVASFVDDLIMPVIGLLTGGVNFTDKFMILKEAVPKDGKPVPEDAYATLASAKANGASVLAYGQFINTVVQFLIVAFAVFLMVKAVNKLRRKEVEAPPEPEALPADVVLLTEIRDLLQAK